MAVAESPWPTQEAEVHVRSALRSLFDVAVGFLRAYENRRSSNVRRGCKIEVYPSCGTEPS